MDLLREVSKKNIKVAMYCRIGRKEEDTLKQEKLAREFENFLNELEKRKNRTMKQVIKTETQKAIRKYIMTSKKIELSTNS